MMIVTNLVLCFVCVQAKAGVGEDQKLLHVIHDAYVSNSRAFPFGRLKFKFTQGFADSAEDARLGRFGETETADGKYVYDEKNALYERLFDPAEMKKKNKIIQDQEMSIIFSFRVVTNGLNTLMEHNLSRSSSYDLSAGDSEFDRRFKLPLPLGRPDSAMSENLGMFVDRILRGERGRIQHVDKSAQYEGRPVAIVTFGFPGGSVKHWIDIERNCLPLNTVQTVDAMDGVPGRQEVTYFDDIRLVPDRGWLIHKEVSWSSSDRRFSEIRILDADFEKRPKTSDFDFVLATARPLIDNAKELVYPARKTWNLDKLPSRTAPGVHKIDQAIVGPSELPPPPSEIEPSRFDPWVVGAALALCVALAVLAFRYKRNYD